MDSCYTDAEVAHLVAAFADCSLPRSHWDHRAHLVVALTHLQGVEFEVGLGRLRSGIRRYNAASGRADGYHETLTVFWARVVAAFLAAEGEGRPLGELATVLCARYGNRQALPFTYYSRERLLSKEARRYWLPPQIELERNLEDP